MEWGIDSLCSPLRGSPFAMLPVCPAGCASSRTPVGASHPPAGVQYAKKKPVLAHELFLKYGGEGGIDSLCSPCGQIPHRLVICPAGCASSRTPVGASHPPAGVQYAKKKPVLAYELFLKYGGEGGIRTPDTLPYTHFPGVLLQPLGHLTILFCCLTAWGATGRYYRELR